MAHALEPAVARDAAPGEVVHSEVDDPQSLPLKRALTFKALVRPVLWALGLGLLQAFSMAWPFASLSPLPVWVPGAWALESGQPSAWAQMVALTGLVLLLHRTTETHRGRARVWSAGLLGWMFAIAWLAGCFWWLFISMHRYGELPAVLAALAVLALAAFLGLYFAVACAVWAVCVLAPQRETVGLVAEPKNLSNWHFVQHLRLLFAIIYIASFASLWMLAELARGQWFTGFPWGATGYAHTSGMAAWVAPWVGAYGVGFAAAAGCAALALALGQFRTEPLAPSWHQSRHLSGHQGNAPSESPSTRQSGFPGKPLITLPRMGGAISVGVLLLLFGLASGIAPEATPNPRPLVAVDLMQGNIPQDEKFIPGKGIQKALQWYSAQARASTANLVVGPETAVPLLPYQLPMGYWQTLERAFGASGGGVDRVGGGTGESAADGAFGSGDVPGAAAGLVAARDAASAAQTSRAKGLGTPQPQPQPQRALLVGIPMGSYEAGYTNSALALWPGQTRLYRYDKHHLVPFGEFIPPLFKWFTRMMNIPLGDFNRGALAQPTLDWAEERFAPHICYEDLFGEEIAKGFANPELAPTVLVNMGNIGWFGDSVAIDQHLHISRMRALEFARPVLRATNTGATAIIAANGAVTHLLPRHTEGVLTGHVQGETRITPFAWWASRLGLWPLWVLGVSVLGLALWFRRHAGERRALPT